MSRWKYRKYCTVYPGGPQSSPLFHPMLSPYVMYGDAVVELSVIFAGNSPCEQQCTPVGGSPQCSCFPGFSLMSDGLSCAGKQLKLRYNAESIFLCHTRVACGNYVQSQEWRTGSYFSSVFFYGQSLVPVEEFLGKNVCHWFVSFSHQRL